MTKVFRWRRRICREIFITHLNVWGSQKMNELSAVTRIFVACTRLYRINCISTAIDAIAWGCPWGRHHFRTNAIKQLVICEEKEKPRNICCIILFYLTISVTSEFTQLNSVILFNLPATFDAACCLSALKWGHLDLFRYLAERRCHRACRESSEPLQCQHLHRPIRLSILKQFRW